MRHSTPVVILALAVAFGAGALVTPLLHHAVSAAHAETVPLTPMFIDLSGLKHDDLPATANPEMHNRTLVVTDMATIGVQSGNVARHMHLKTDEIQYILEGSGAMWLGGERKEFKAGTLLVIPKGTAHGGTLVSSGPVRALVIKLPPQAKDDVVFAN